MLHAGAVASGLSILQRTKLAVASAGGGDGAAAPTAPSANAAGHDQADSWGSYTGMQSADKAAASKSVVTKTARAVITLDSDSDDSAFEDRPGVRLPKVWHDEYPLTCRLSSLRYLSSIVASDDCFVDRSVVACALHAGFCCAF